MDVPIPEQRVRDPWEKSVPGLDSAAIRERTPMQWDESENAGFSNGEPWLPLARAHAMRNVASLAADPAPCCRSTGA